MNLSLRGEYGFYVRLRLSAEGNDATSMCSEDGRETVRKVAMVLGISMQNTGLDDRVDEDCY